MTSRPSVGIPRQPQRSLSGLGSVSAPAPRRSLNSQPYRPTSPLKKENFIDLTDDGPSEPTLSRQASAKLGGSRLKLEISNEASRTPSTASPRPADITTPSKPFPPPRGRPRLQFDASSGFFSGSDAVGLAMPPEESTNLNQQPLPMPIRPHQHQHQRPTIQKPKPASNAPAKKDSRPKPYNLEPPAAAPRYPPNGYSDFFPWTGNHPEDCFNETAIRQGYYDKPTSQSETSSAKAVLFPFLKHKQGLQSLSSLFTGVLSLRRSHGQIISNSTFKPPPRVTLTDTKREMWLRDLANPAISLRRLSRTIPHGIRGKVLLEQCLSKNIPTERAVWLAKCVGANEIRAFKRKGISGTFAMGGEAKWIRDWTAFVEQFLESIVNACGEKEWKSRITYAVRLAAHLYSEHLLDRDHYLDWLTTSLENCHLSKIPIWLLITQVYWKYLLQNRKYGRRLVGAICSHLHASTSNPDRDLYTPIIDRISELLTGLVLSHPHNFVSPTVWSKYADTIRSTLTNNDPQFKHAIDAIDRRNKRFSIVSNKIDTSPRRRIIQLLDASTSKFVSDDLAQRCWETTTDRGLLVQTVLDWATSPYRPDISKVFVGARLLRTWAHLDINVTDEVLVFLGSRIEHGICDSDALYHVISELARSGHFSVAKYLQWLIARGGLKDAAEIATDAPYATRLLAELPVHNLSESITYLRESILNRAGFSTDEEKEQFEFYTTFMTNFLDSTQPDSMEVDASNLPTDFDMAEHLSRSSRAIKSNIGIWLRSEVRDRKLLSVSRPTENWKDATGKEGSIMLSSMAFNQIRLDLEATQDFSILADVLKFSTLSTDPVILAAVANTVNLHAETMAAIGALKDLFETLSGRLRLLLSQQNYDCRVLLVSLIKLASRIPGTAMISAQLVHELAQIDRKTAADVCSPVSDHMVEVIQNTELDFTDELEKLLASGTSIDQPTLERLFQVIMTRLEASWIKFPDQQRTCGVLLARLRTFDTNAFDNLMLFWVQSFLQNPVRQSMAHGLAPLISVGCVSLKDVILTSLRLLEQSSFSAHTSAGPMLALETITLLISHTQLPAAMTSEDVYTLRISQHQLVKDDPTSALRVIQRAAEMTSLSLGLDESIRDQLISCCRSTQVRQLMKGLVLSNVNAARRSLIGSITTSEDSQVKALLDFMIHNLVSPVSSDSPEQTLARIHNALRLSDDLSLPFCQLEIEVILATGVIDPTSEEDRRKQCLAALGNAIISAVASNSNTTWTSLMPVLDASIVGQIREGAQRNFLDLYPHLKQMGTRDFESSADTESARRLLLVIEATATDSAETGGLDFAAQVVDKLNHTWQLVSQGTAIVQQAVAQSWLPVLLSLLNMNINMFDTHKTGSELRARAIILLSALLVETERHLINVSLSPPLSSVLETILDTTMILSDNLADDARMGCIRLIKDKSSDPRIQYILGYGTRPMDSLQLNQKGKTVPFNPRRWELLSEPTPIVGENDTSLSLTLFQARKG